MNQPDHLVIIPNLQKFAVPILLASIFFVPIKKVDRAYASFKENVKGTLEVGKLFMIANRRYSN